MLSAKETKELLARVDIDAVQGNSIDLAEHICKTAFVNTLVMYCVDDNKDQKKVVIPMKNIKSRKEALDLVRKSAASIYKLGYVPLAASMLSLTILSDEPGPPMEGDDDPHDIDDLTHLVISTSTLDGDHHVSSASKIHKVTKSGNAMVCKAGPFRKLTGIEHSDLTEFVAKFFVTWLSLVKGASPEELCIGDYEFDICHRDGDILSHPNPLELDSKNDDDAAFFRKIKPSTN